MEDIKVYELVRKDLKDAVVIDGFPSVGLVSSIVANYLINTLNLEQVGIMDSIYFPTVSLVRGAEPLNPVRIYAGDKIGEEGGERDQIVAFISEFQPPPNLVKPIASTMLDWAIDQKCGLMISPEGLVIDREGESESEEGPAPNGEGKKEAPPEEDKERMDVYAIGSTKRARDLIIKKHGLQSFDEGVITGVAGVLLNEGKRRDYSVISLLAEARPDFPDARAAARVIEELDKLIPNIKLDAGPLYSEAARIESQLKTIQKQSEPQKRPKSVASPSMYR